MDITHPAIKKAVRAKTTRSTASPSLFAVKGRLKADGTRESRPERWCLPSVSWFALTPHVPKSSCPPAHQGVATPFLGGQRGASPWSRAAFSHRDQKQSQETLSILRRKTGSLGPGGAYLSQGFALWLESERAG